MTLFKAFCIFFSGFVTRRNQQPQQQSTRPSFPQLHQQLHRYDNIPFDPGFDPERFDPDPIPLPPRPQQQHHSLRPQPHYQV